MNKVQFSLQQHVLGICDVQSCILTIVFKYKFCSYNFVLNEASGSNYATRVGNNVRLTAVGAQQFSMVVI